MDGQANSWLGRIFEPVSGQSLAIVRIVFGLVLAYEALWYLGATPWSKNVPLELFLIGSHVKWRIPVAGWEWLPALSDPAITGLVWLLLAGAIGMVVGSAYRISATVAAVSFTYLFLLEATFYLNHFYLTCLIAWMMAAMPADRCWSWRSWSQSRRGLTGQAATGSVPACCLAALRWQLFLMYCYAGVAKLNPDWLAGEPLRGWLSHPETAQKLTNWWPSAEQPVRDLLRQEGLVYFLAYGGLVFDLVIGLLLLSPRLRLLAFALVAVFHTTNFFLFDIGAFPFMALGLTTIFLAPDWPGQFVNWFQRVVMGRPSGAIPAAKERHSADVSRNRAWHATLAGVMLVWFSLQLLLPLRHFVIAGDVSWTEEGHRYSWRMKLRTKDPGLFLVEVAELPRRVIPTLPTDPDWQHVTFHAVDSAAPGWEDLPPLLVTFDPIVGERIWLNPLSQEGWQDQVAQLQSFWRKHFQETPQFTPTKSLDEVLASLVPLAGKSAAGRQLRVARAQLRLMSDPDVVPGVRHHALVQFQETMRGLVSIARLRKPLLNGLLVSHPFAIQGGCAPPGQLMTLMSRQALKTDSEVAIRIDRSQLGMFNDVFLDPGRLAAAGWRGLPEAMVTVLNGRQHVYWNYTVELHEHQSRAVRTSPLLQQVHARHVADRIHVEQGERPRVYITSFVQMNHHPMQLMTDPEYDLAAEPRPLLAHRPWIHSLNRAEARR